MSLLLVYHDRARAVVSQQRAWPREDFFLAGSKTPC